MGGLSRGRPPRRVAVHGHARAAARPPSLRRAPRRRGGRRGALDFAPDPDGRAGALFAPQTVAAELQRLADQQQDDGGWPLEFAGYSPAAALEWRGHLTAHALSILKRNALL